MDLAGEDLKPSRDHVFHLRFPKEWKTQDLKQLFQEQFGDVYVAWIDDTQAFVALREKELAVQVNIIEREKNPENCQKAGTHYPYLWWNQRFDLNRGK